MRYLSVCSGIEAATVAWHDLGWTPVAFSEIEPFPSAVLAHHYPNVPNVGDMTKFKEWNLEPINLLVGGTPCQSFSVAGLRKGLDDPRGNLMLTFLAIAERERPKWIVWENVPGVLSSNGGRDFGTFLGALGELGYGWAYRVLDAQWFGVAQRRRRVFVVGCLGDQAGAAAVLFESESVQRNPAPSREKGQGVAGTIAARFGISRNNHEECVPTVAGSLDTECGGGKLTHQSVANGHIIGTLTARMMNALGARDVEEGALLPVAQPVAYGIDGEQNASEELIGTLRSHQSGGYEGARVAQPVAFAQNTRDEVRLMNGDGSIVGALAAEPGMKQTCYVAQPVAIPIHDQATRFAGKRGDKQDGKGNGFGVGNPGDPCPTLTKGDKHAVAQPVALGTDCYNGAITGEVAATIGTPGSSVNASGPTVMQVVAPALTASNDPSRSPQSSEVTQQVTAVHTMQVRRLTPTECERLQGFPDGYTNIPWRKKDEAPDGPRYKALGNSMAVPCMRSIGERIQAATERQEVQP